jgi:CheY-like chemotaxis protein
MAAHWSTRRGIGHARRAGAAPAPRRRCVGTLVQQLPLRQSGAFRIRAKTREKRLRIDLHRTKSCNSSERPLKEPLLGRVDSSLGRHSLAQASLGPNDDPDPSGVRRQRSLRVLVADDEPLVGAALRRVLAAHEVVVVGGGLAAVEAIRTQAPFDVVICDVMMPDLSGPRVYESVRETHPALLGRFLFITGGVIHEGCRRFLASMPDQVLYKPFDLCTVREKVRRTAGIDGDDAVEM